MFMQDSTKIVKGIESLMKRCLENAHRAAGNTAPNPMVGAMLVHGDRIIAEGWHHEYGQAHAEVDCLNNVAETDRHLIPECTMVVTLEPCAHTGKTPPCALRIIKEGIKKVIIANTDPFEQVNGTGIQLLRTAGVQVETGVCEREGLWLNRRFFCFHTFKRPYIILKWAKTADGFIAPVDGTRVQITNKASMMLTHKWRTEEAAIMVGANTAYGDNPSLTPRLWAGKAPLRIAIDRKMTLPKTHQLLNGDTPTWILNDHTNDVVGNTRYIKINFGSTFPDELMLLLHHHKILSMIVEGGAQLLDSFITTGLWDEARIFTGDIVLGDGIPAPLLKNGRTALKTSLGDDKLDCFVNAKSDYQYVPGMEF